MKKQRRWVLIAALLVAVAVVVVIGARPSRLVLTGLVTTDEVIVSSQIPGRLEQLNVKPGDAVKRGQLVAVVAPAEMQADVVYYQNVAQSTAAQVGQAEADLQFQQELTRQQVRQAEANLAAAQAQVVQAQADLDIAHLNLGRAQSLRRSEANSVQEFDLARTTADSAQARVDALQKQVAAAQAAVSLAQAGAAQVAAREAALRAMRQQQAAAAAQQTKAEVHLGYTQIHAPTDGIVNVRAALPGEVVTAGQAIVTLVDPDNLWVRADVEESYVDRIRLGDQLTVRLPSGSERAGTVFFRGVDADYATQRDVSRSKRDIRTFELRLRCDNRDRSLAVGQTAFVVLPFAH